MTVRPEQPADQEAIREVNRAAFGVEGEGRLVDRLRQEGLLRLSLVAEEQGRVVGHIAFSAIRLEGREVLSLAPMAVLPAFQRQGIGSALVRAGLAALALPVVVLGHPEYYPRFGFSAAHAAGLRCAWSGPALMATEPLSGELIYPDAFAEV